MALHSCGGSLAEQGKEKDKLGIPVKFLAQLRLKEMEPIRRMHWLSCWFLGNQIIESMRNDVSIQGTPCDLLNTGREFPRDGRRSGIPWPSLKKQVALESQDLLVEDLRRTCLRTEEE